MSKKQKTSNFNNFTPNTSYKFITDEIVKNTKNTEDNIYNEFLKKFKHSEANYNKNNRDKIENNKKSYCSLVHYYPINKEKDINIEYNKQFKYSLDIKIEGISKNLCVRLLKFILDKSNDEERKSFFIKDTKMEAYLQGKFNDCSRYNIYYLKAHCDQSLEELLENKYINYNKAIDNILQHYFNNLRNINNVSNSDAIENLNYIIKFYESCNNFIWIKSQGEFICLISLVLFLGSVIQINKKDILNPLSNRNLEIDFYLAKDQLAIEVDGKQHKSDKNTIKNDTIKNILLESNDITLIRCEWNNDIKIFTNNLYDNLSSFHLKKLNAELNISKEKYNSIMNEILKKIRFPSFSYMLDIELKLPNDFEKDINKYIINKHNINMYIDNINTNNIIKFNQTTNVIHV